MKTEANNQFAPLYEDLDLYRVPEMEKDKAILKAEGKNLKNMLVLVEGELATDEKELLLKILSALGLTSLDVVLVSFAEKKYPVFSFLKSNFKFEKLIGFGVSPEMLSVNINAALNKIFTVQETAMLFSHSLKSLAADENKKKALWKALQIMFERKNV